MSIPDKIVNSIKTLSESKQIEVFDFVEYLKQKTEKEANTGWSNMSLSSAMRGLDIDEASYSQGDLKEVFNDL